MGSGSVSCDNVKSWVWWGRERGRKTVWMWNIMDFRTFPPQVIVCGVSVDWIIFKRQKNTHFNIVQLSSTTIPNYSLKNNSRIASLTRSQLKQRKVS